MLKSSNVTLKVYFSDPELDDDERNDLAKWLITEISREGIADSASPLTSQSEPGKKGFQLVPGWLVAIVTKDHFLRLLTFVGDRLKGKAIELEVEDVHRKLKLKVHSRAELETAMQSAKEFISQG